MKFEGAGSMVAQKNFVPFTNKFSSSQDPNEMAEVAVDK
jgi:hypothetical protein